MRNRILIVFGTRPEAIKMAPIYKILKEESNSFETKLCITGQHREMLDQVLELFDINADIDLDIMGTNQDLFDVTSKIILKMKDVLLSVNPDLVMVHGDTTTALATSIAAFYSDIKVCHVEAGLRTHNLKSPFPEEFNRQIISKISSFHLSPTQEAKQNLLGENIDSSKILVTGNTVIDALFLTLDNIANDSAKEKDVISRLNKIIKTDWRSSRFVLITGHRRENFGEGFKNICLAISKLATIYPHINFIYPLHLNPKVKSPVENLLGSIGNIHLIPPLSYELFTYLLKECYVVLTDSGGIQEEAPSLGKPVLVMRNTTERPEAVEAGTVRLVGTNSKEISENLRELLDDPDIYNQMSKAHNPYGDGKACGRILEYLQNLF